MIPWYSIYMKEIGEKITDKTTYTDRRGKPVSAKQQNIFARMARALGDAADRK